MINELVPLTKKRIAQGQTKEQLKEDFLKFGYSEADFETAYTEAVSHTESDTVLPPVKEKKATPYDYESINFLIPSTVLLVVAVAGWSAYAYFFQSATEDFLPPEGEPFFKSQIVTNIEPTPLPIETTPSTEAVSSTGTATSSTETVPEIEPSSVINEEQTAPSTPSATGEISDILLCKTILPLLGVSDGELASIQASITADMLKTIEADIKNNTVKEPRAKELCILDLVLSDRDLKQKALALYVSNINKKYSTNLTSLSTADRLNLISKYELELGKKTANNSVAKSLIVDVRTDVLLCTDYGTFTEPKEGEKICASQTYTWPVLSKHGASWGGCETKVSSKDDSTFKYCAILSDGTVVVCNEDGCDFSGQN